MKRYNLKANYVDAGLDPRRPVHASILTIHEADNGEWVRYEDALLIDKARQLLVGMTESAAKQKTGFPTSLTEEELEAFFVLAGSLGELRREITALERRLEEINDTIFAEGAPLGSDRYFTIRGLAVVK